MTAENHRRDAKFQACFAVYLVTLAALYITGITFATVPKDNQRVVDTVLGFLLGTLIATVVGYFYGASKVLSPTPPEDPAKPTE